MMKKTPLRLVAIDGGVDEEEDAAPLVEVQEQDAITRRVPNPVADSEMFPATPAPALVPMTGLPPGKAMSTKQGTSINAATAVFVNTVSSPIQASKSGATWKIAAGVGAAVVVLVLVAALAFRKGAEPAPVASPAPPAQRVEAPVPPPKPAEAATVAAVAPAAKPGPETIRLQVTADPMDTKLSLDGNVVAGRILNLAVPRDRGIHVLSASAPGYIPFNQQVSFENDVVLTITLRRSSATSSRSSSRSRSAAVESRAKSEAPRASATTAPRSGAAFEPGMNLEMPAARPSGAKAIDERNPYKP